MLVSIQNPQVTVMKDSKGKPLAVIKSCHAHKHILHNEDMENETLLGDFTNVNYNHEIQTLFQVIEYTKLANKAIKIKVEIPSARELVGLPSGFLKAGNYLVPIKVRKEVTVKKETSNFNEAFTDFKPDENSVEDIACS